MQNQELYSIRMRAAEGGAHEVGGRHISGSEQFTTKEQLHEDMRYLIDKAFSHERGEPDFFQVVVEKVKEKPLSLEPLHVHTYKVNSIEAGRELAVERLRACGISDVVIQKGFRCIEEFYNVNGALVIDATTGEMLANSNSKGIRASHLHWDNKNYETWLKTKGITHNQRMKEALTLATKVCSHSETVAELCYSDDPNYVTGYVASSKNGYERISRLKEYGSDKGGRIFFVKHGTDIETYRDYLQQKPVFIELREEENG